MIKTLPPSPTPPAYWHQALTELGAADTVMQAIISRIGDACLHSRGEPFETLLRSIVGQQISVKAAHSIWLKVAHCIGADVGKATPEAVLAQPIEALRACGLSAKKVSYLQSLSQHFQAGTVNPMRWHTLSDEALIQELIQVNGIGKWTAQMVLMFNALRPDVFPIDDLAIRKALCRHYGMVDDKAGRQAMLQKAQDWQPWRTVASWLLWRSLDMDFMGLSEGDVLSAGIDLKSATSY
jgi:DNA-3-methyladenine glycosylase II